MKITPNKAVKPFAALTRTSGAPRLFAHGFAMIAQTPLHTSRRLPGRCRGRFAPAATGRRIGIH